MPTFRKNVWIAATLGLTGVVVAAVVVFGRPVAKAETTSTAYTPKAKGTLTYTKDIAPIVQGNCVSCHRPGEIGPFPLLSYQDVKKRAVQLTLVTEKRSMPPWHADSHGEFVGERRLTAEQIGMIKQWAEEGAKEGNPADLPLLPKFTEGWALGKPDVILEAGKEYRLGAEGTDVYRNFVLPNTNTEDKYVAAMEVRPGNTKVVHHVIAYLDSSGKGRQLEASNSDGNGGYSTLGGGTGVGINGTLGGWAPGNLPRLLPDGIGTLWPKGADIVLQVHYHKSGKPETDRTRIGLYFCKTPVDKRLRILPVFAPVRIPAGEANYTTNSFAMPVLNDSSIVEVMPHMHLLGKDMTITAKLPGGAQKRLISVPNYDFNWQTTYLYKEPVKVPKGSSISLVAHYDNSDKNPRNPSRPPRTVGWGEQTTDEMCIGFVFYTLDAERISKGEKVSDLADLISGFGRRNGGQGGARPRLRNLLNRNSNP
jgi:hypothetical protein